MKAYLVLDLTIHDFAGFKPYIAGIPAFIEKHSGKYIVQGVQPTTMEGDWSRSGWSSSSSLREKMQRHF